MCLVRAVPVQKETITAKTSNGLVFSLFGCHMVPGLKRNKKRERIHTCGIKVKTVLSAAFQSDT